MLFYLVVGFILEVPIGSSYFISVTLTTQEVLMWTCKEDRDV